jgi:helix-turn-helix protein
MLRFYPARETGAYRQPTSSREPLTLREAARQTGIARDAMVAAFRAGHLPRIRDNGRMRVTLRDLAEWQRSGSRAR